MSLDSQRDSQYESACGSAQDDETTRCESAAGAARLSAEVEVEAPAASPSPATPITAADAQLAIKRSPNWGFMSGTEVGSLCSPSTPGSWTPDNSPPCEEKENASGSHNLQSGALQSGALQSRALAPSPPPAHASEGVPALNLNVKLNGTVKAPLEVSSGGLSSGGLSSGVLTTPSLKLVGFSEADPSTIEPRFASPLSPLSPFSKRPFVSYELRVGLPHSGGECGWSVHRRFSQFVTLAEELKALDATSLKQCRAEQMLPSRLRLPSTLAIEASERISGLQASVSYEDLDCAYVVSSCASHAPHFCPPVFVPFTYRLLFVYESRLTLTNQAFLDGLGAETSLVASEAFESFVGASEEPRRKELWRAAIEAPPSH